MFNLVLLTILFYHASSSFFLTIGLYFLIPAVIAQIFNPTTEHVMSIGIPTKEVKTKIERHPEITEIKESKY